MTVISFAIPKKTAMPALNLQIHLQPTYLLEEQYYREKGRYSIKSTVFSDACKLFESESDFFIRVS